MTSHMSIRPSHSLTTRLPSVLLTTTTTTCYALITMLPHSESQFIHLHHHMFY